MRLQKSECENEIECMRLSGVSEVVHIFACKTFEPSNLEKIDNFGSI